MIWEMDQYMSKHLKRKVWTIFEDKDAALATAERLIRNLPIDLPETAQEWPDDIKEAVFECAVAFADGVDPDKEYRLLSKTTHGYGPLRQQRDTSMIEQYLAMGIPSYEAWRILSKYLPVSESVRLERVT